MSVIQLMLVMERVHPFWKVETNRVNAQVGSRLHMALQFETLNNRHCLVT